jgi:hypothetical protein
MTHQGHPSTTTAGADPGRQVAQLREVLKLVGQLGGRRIDMPADDRLDEAARISVAYDRALPIVQRRFDALAAETAEWAAAGVEALLIAGEGARIGAATARLGAQIERALGELAELLE